MESFKFFRNSDCKYFPCHKVDDEETFNCLFCYCPLYTLGDECGGNYIYTENGVKNCTNCLIPHSLNGYDYIMDKLDLIIDKARKKD